MAETKNALIDPVQRQNAIEIAKKAEKLAIPYGRGASGVIELLQEAGLDPPPIPEKDNRCYTYKVDGYTYGFLKSGDMAEAVDKRIIDVGFAGSDKLDEATLAGELSPRIGRIACIDAGCSLIVAGTVEAILKPDMQIATSYPLQAKEWLDQNGYTDISIPTFTPKGKVEAYIGLGFADAIVDIRESGESLVQNGILYWKPIQNVTTDLVYIPRLAMAANKPL